MRLGISAAAVISKAYRPHVTDKSNSGEQTITSYREVSEIHDGMRIDWDMPINCVATYSGLPSMAAIRSF